MQSCYSGQWIPCFWQLSMKARKWVCHIGCPVVRTDRRKGVRSRDYWHSANKTPKTNFFPFFFFSTTIEERVETKRRLYVYSHNHCPAGYWKKKLMRLLTLPSPVRPFRSLCCAFFHMHVTSATVSVSVIWPSCQVKAKGKEWPWNGRQVTMGFPSDCPPKSTN